MILQFEHHLYKGLKLYSSKFEIRGVLLQENSTAITVTLIELQ